MKRFYYDFHIHTALSPCGDDDNTPNNVVNMAMLNGLDVIAIADHNSCKNARAAMAVGEQVGVLVLPAMELTTSEEIHVLCLFSDVENAERFSEYVAEHSMPIENKVESFGNQFIMNEEDEILGQEKRLLIMASDIGIYDVKELVDSFGGIAIPAHVDREMGGAVMILGGLDDAMGFSTVEISGKAPEDFVEKHALSHYRTISDSDAHQLWKIAERKNFLELEELTRENIIRLLKQVK